MLAISITPCVEVAEFGEVRAHPSRPVVEAWAVAMHENVPAAALAQSLDQVQGQLINDVSGPH